MKLQEIKSLDVQREQIKKDLVNIDGILDTPELLETYGPDLHLHSNDFTSDGVTVEGKDAVDLLRLIRLQLQSKLESIEKKFDDAGINFG